jgi:hypothetical protein
MPYVKLFQNMIIIISSSSSSSNSRSGGGGSNCCFLLLSVKILKKLKISIHNNILG